MFESRFSLFEKKLLLTLYFFYLLELKGGKYSPYYITNSTAFPNNLLISFKFLSSKNPKQHWPQTIIGWCDLITIQLNTSGNYHEWLRLFYVSSSSENHSYKMDGVNPMDKKNVNATNKIKTHTNQTNIKNISRARCRFTTM